MKDGWYHFLGVKNLISTWMTFSPGWRSWTKKKHEENWPMKSPTWPLSLDPTLIARNHGFFWSKGNLAWEKPPTHKNWRMTGQMNKMNGTRLFHRLKCCSCLDATILNLASGRLLTINFFLLISANRLKRISSDTSGKIRQKFCCFLMDWMRQIPVN